MIECIGSLLSTLEKDQPILLLDDASTDVRIERTLRPIAAREGMCYVCKETNRGLVDSANFAFAVGDPRDVVILNSDILLPPGWLERLRRAATAASTSRRRHR